MHHYPSMVGHPKEDAVAGVVVFLVALPLCLGIAIACGVPPVSGLVAGVVGGMVVPWISRSPLSVTGPAAGLTSIVLAEVSKVGLNGFLMGVVIELAALKVGMPAQARLFIATGILGGYTTFSTFSLEAGLLHSRGDTAFAVGYAMASVLLGVGGFFLGMHAVRAAVSA